MTGSPSSADEHDHHFKKKRVGKACDSCRIKKTKCDGKKPCSRCIMDNKICVFTDKKKGKEKPHPSGYVELLETRLDLLTKSLEKMVQLARPHLSFLDELVEEEDEAVPINRVVLYLINNKGLLSNLPVEWEKGALIAANLENGTDKVKLAAEKFHEHNHKLKLNDDKQSSGDYSAELLRSPGDDSDLKEGPVQGEGEDLQGSSYQTTSSVADYDSAKSPMSNSLTETLNLDDFSLGGYSSNFMIPGSSDFVSDFETDSSQSVGHPTRASLFSNDYTSNSITSLTSDFENHQIHSPTSLSSIMAPSLSSASIRRSSSLTHRPFSPSHQKLKNIGHVFKPHHAHTHPHASNHQSIRSNNGNEFHLSKGVTSPGGSMVKGNPSSFVSLLSELDEDTLPSDAFKLQGYNKALNIMDTESVDGFLISNPFLR